MTFLSVSFELMRKEQQKAFQEKQKLNPEKRKDGFDISTLMEDSKDEKILLNKSNESGDSVILKNSNNDSEKSSLPPQTPASRPLVPPGFTSTNMERNLGPKSVIHPHTVEVPIFYFNLIGMHGKVIYLKKEIRKVHTEVGRSCMFLCHKNLIQTFSCHIFMIQGF